MSLPRKIDETNIDQLLAGLETAVEHKRYGGQWHFFAPYAKQKEFLDLGATKRERLFMAGNQNGKSITGAFEGACHATGKYPDWWGGRRFTRPTRGWTCGETGEVIRDVMQRKMYGAPGVEADWGTGMISRADLVDKSRSRGAMDLLDTVQVRHVSGGVSTITAKSYEQGRPKFQGESVDWLWFDEEPPMDVYAEGLTRTTATNGIVFITFTPLRGRTDVVNRFLDEANPDRVVVSMTIDDALHISAEQRAGMIAAWPVHMREARAMGVPMLGSGRILTTPEEQIIEERIEPRNIPPYWAKIWGIDIGIGHPFAAVLLLWDKDADVIHVHHTIRMSDALPIMHAAAMRPVGAEVPVAYPKDAGDRDRGTGVPIARLYKQQGLKLLHDHATHPEGGVSTEAGIMEWDERERTGRLKVARHLSDWLEERRMYHRKDGQIVKVKDDLMSATRVGLMMKRFAKSVQLGGGPPPGGNGDPGQRFAVGSANHPGGAYDIFGI
jgi:phage terminase large subunit-like protein